MVVATCIRRSMRCAMTSGKLDGRVAAALKDIADMKPTVQAIKDAKQRVAGATWFSTWLYRFAIFVSGGAAWVIVSISTWLMRTRPSRPIRQRFGTIYINAR